MKTLNMKNSIFFLLLQFSLLLSIEARAQHFICDTLYLLTNDSVKYWDDTNNLKRCISFSFARIRYQQFNEDSSTGRLCNDTIEELRRVCHEYEYHNNYKPHVKRYLNPSSSHLAGEDYEIKDGELLFYERRSDVLLAKYQIIKLTPDSLIIEQKGGKKVYVQSCDQVKRGENLPHLQIGYEWPQLKTSQVQINAMIKSAYKKTRQGKGKVPREFRVLINPTISYRGVVKEISLLKTTPDKKEYALFYNTLIQELKSLSFIPAKNRVNGETYGCDNMSLPIHYKRVK